MADLQTIGAALQAALDEVAAAEAPAPTPTPTPTPTGVLRSFNFDAASQLGVDLNENYAQTGHYLGYDDASSVGHGTVVAGSPAIANGKLRFTFQPNSGQNDAGKWVARFTPDDSRTFGPGDTFYARFKWKNDGMVFDANACPEGTKLAFLDGAGDTFGRPECPLTLIVCTYYASGVPMIYQYAQFAGGPGIYTLNDVYKTPAVPKDEEVTFEIGVKLGQPLTGNLLGQIDGIVVMDMIRADGTRHRVVDYRPGWVNTSNAPNYSYAGLPWGNGQYRYGTLTLLPYSTAKDATITTPEYHFEYDDAAISDAPFSAELDLTNETLSGVTPTPTPTPTAALPAWRQTFPINVLTDISTNTLKDAFVAAGYYVDAWKGDSGEGNNYSAWSGGVSNPYLGNYGRWLCGSNGHEAAPGSTIHQFDYESATWLAPLVGPQKHRQVAPDYAAPPAGAEIWFNPDRRGVDGVNFTDESAYTFTDSGGTKYTGIWAIIAEQRAIDHPFADGAMSFAYYPFKYAARYAEDVGSSMRYDGYCVIPPDGGGEANGTLYLGPMGFGDTFDTFASGGSMWSWLVGCTSQKWLPRSVDQMVIRENPENGNFGNGGDLGTAYSSKYKTVFVLGNVTASLGTFDPATRKHGWVNVNAAYYPSHVMSSLGGPAASVITEGHSAHLMLTIGFDPWQSTQRLGLWVMDIDEAFPQINVWKALHTGVVPWSIINATDTDIKYARQKALFTPDLTINPGGARTTLAWSAKHQKLIVVSVPTHNLSTPTTLPVPEKFIQIVTIPEGSTNGVPNWQTQPWAVETRTITSPVGVRVGVIPTPYRRASWEDKIDCLINVGDPAILPVQALALW